MSRDPVVHDQHLNEAFRSDVPKKPQPESSDESIKIPWVKVVPKFSNLLGVQITDENIANIALRHGWEATVRTRGLRPYLLVPSQTGDVKAWPDDWLIISDDNWDLITVCSAEAFTRSYEVASDA